MVIKEKGFVNMEEIDLKEVFNLFWSKRTQIVLIIIVFMLVGFVYAIGFKTPEYSSSTTLILAASGKEGTSAITATDITLNSKLLSTYSEVVKSKNVLRNVIANLDIEEEEVRRKVSVSSVKDTELIKITVTNMNPDYATKIANEIAKVFTQKVKDIYKINNIYVLDEAEISQQPTNINYQRDMIIFMVIGIGVSILYVFILSILDTTIKTVEDIEKEFNLPVLVTIPLCESEAPRKGGKK